MSEVMGPVESRDCPYLGLDYYRENFGAWYFGREADGAKIISNLRAARLTLLYAESGVGKSSLLRAGVASRLRRVADASVARRGTPRSIPIVFSSWKDDPLAELTAAIQVATSPYMAGGPESPLSADRLDAVIETVSKAVNASLLIMLDQFDEYFLYSSRESTPRQFADEVARCINRADLRANFLIAIREDTYAGLGELFKGRIANVYGNYLRIDYLDRTSAEKAIRGPLEIYNSQPGVSERVEIEDALVEAVLDQTGVYAWDSEAGASLSRVAAPLLQLVMETIWTRERAAGSPILRLSTLQRLSGVGRIVDVHLADALGSLSSRERETAMDAFDHLVTPSGGTIAESVPDLALRTGRSEEEVGTVMAKLDQARIVRPVPAPLGQDPLRFRRYELFHSVLAPTINRAIATRDEIRRARRMRRLAVLAVALLIFLLAVTTVLVYLVQAAGKR